MLILHWCSRNVQSSNKRASDQHITNQSNTQYGNKNKLYLDFSKLPIATVLYSWRSTWRVLLLQFHHKKIYSIFWFTLKLLYHCFSYDKKLNAFSNKKLIMAARLVHSFFLQVSCTVFRQGLSKSLKLTSVQLHQNITEPMIQLSMGQHDHHLITITKIYNQTCWFHFAPIKKEKYDLKTCWTKCNLILCCSLSL